MKIAPGVEVADWKALDLSTPDSPDWELQLLRKAAILSVRADPEPRDLLILPKPDGTASEGHTDQVNGVAIVDLLEVEAGAAWREISQLVGVEFRRSAG